MLTNLWLTGKAPDAWNNYIDDYMFVGIWMNYYWLSFITIVYRMCHSW
jgi:hypothetical protein